MELTTNALKGQYMSSLRVLTLGIESFPKPRSVGAEQMINDQNHGKINRYGLQLQRSYRMVARRGSVWGDVSPCQSAVGASEMIKYDSATPMVPGFVFDRIPDISMSGYQSKAPNGAKRKANNILVYEDNRVKSRKKLHGNDRTPDAAASVTMSNFS